MGFYGNIKFNNQTPLIFDKIYGSRREMEDNCNSDGIFNGRYVLISYSGKEDSRYINYHYLGLIPRADYGKPGVTYYVINSSGRFVQATGWKEDVQYYVANPDITATESDVYAVNRFQDEAAYHQSYDHTVWQKIWTQTQEEDNVIEKYIMVANFQSEAPHISLTVDAPHDTNAADTYFPIPTDLVGQEDGYISKQKYDLYINDLYLSNKTHPTAYSSTTKYYLKRVGTNVGAPHFDPVYSTPMDYKLHIPRQWKIAESVPFEYNDAGFHKENVGYKTNPVNNATFTESASGDEYATYADQNYSVGKYKKVGGVWVPETEVQDDTKNLSLRVDSIGNAISQMWDTVFPKINNGTKRDTYLGNPRLKPSNDNTNYPPTLAQAVGKAYDLLGLKTDKAITPDKDGKTVSPVYDTLYGNFNSIKDFLGTQSDGLSDNTLLGMWNDMKKNHVIIVDKNIAQGSNQVDINALWNNYNSYTSAT